MPIRRSQKKRNAEPRQKQNHRRLVIDPMVNTGNSAHRHQARPKADPARPHHRMVTLAQSSPGDRSACAPQSKTATVMLGCMHRKNAQALKCDIEKDDNRTANKTKRRQQCTPKVLDMARPGDARSVMVSLASSGTTRGELRFVPRSAS